MTDKQIIIDNVDVSGCEYYFDEKCRCMDASIMQDFYSCPQCNSNPNCSYKNWKRKEQECKKLNLKIIELNSMNETLKSECENCGHLDLYMKLKQTLTEIKEIAEKGYESFQLTKLILDLILQTISECEVNNDR